MKTLLACCMCACLSSASVRHCNAQELTEFGVSQNVSVETVTCGSFFIHYDFTQYGSITGSSCVATNPLPTQGASTQGHLTVSFDFGGGNIWTVKGCRVDSATGSPGYYHYAINCT